VKYLKRNIAIKMKKIKLTCSHAIVKHLIAQKILIEGRKEALFAGAFGIFGHVY
jgi:3D-(3,5/4)-trihydroxycyclohexane-1,2-dione acylhydrolase (decyclizing)